LNCWKTGVGIGKFENSIHCPEKSEIYFGKPDSLFWGISQNLIGIFFFIRTICMMKKPENFVAKA